MVKLSDTLTLIERKDGYWIHDKIQGINVALRAKTERDAFVMALSFYQKYYYLNKQKNESIYKKVNSFIEDLSKDDDIHFPCDCDIEY